MFYEFQCQTCGHIFEIQKSIKDDSNEDCPECGKESLRVITGGAGFLIGKSSPAPACTPDTCGQQPSSCPMGHQCGMA